MQTVEDLAGSTWQGYMRSTMGYPLDEDCRDEPWTVSACPHGVMSKRWPHDVRCISGDELALYCAMPPKLQHLMQLSPYSAVLSYSL